MRSRNVQSIGKYLVQSFEISGETVTISKMNLRYPNSFILLPPVLEDGFDYIGGSSQTFPPQIWRLNLSAHSDDSQGLNSDPQL